MNSALRLINSVFRPAMISRAGGMFFNAVPHGALSRLQSTHLTVENNAHVCPRFDFYYDTEIEG